MCLEKEVVWKDELGNYYWFRYPELRLVQQVACIYKLLFTAGVYPTCWKQMHAVLTPAIDQDQ